MSSKKQLDNPVAEVRIAIADVASELSFECPSTLGEIRNAVSQALASGEPLVLSDLRGREIIVPSGKIGFVEIGEQSERRVGFGTN